MQRYMRFVIVAGLLIVGLIFGCTDRKRNVPNGPEISNWNIETAAKHVFHPYLRFQLVNGNSFVNMGIYMPRVSMPEPNGSNQRVPVLVLLPPQNGDEYFYYNHGLFRLAEDMIASGEIQPMGIVCLGNDRIFGGYFYGNSYPAGMYDSIIGQDLFEYIESSHPMILNERSKRGIGGIGQGAYGAFRSAIKHPEAYSSVSAVDGPLDFDGADGNHGLKDLFRTALDEQGLTAATFKQFDSAKAFPISEMFIGGALAFSPHDTSLTDSAYVQFIRRDNTKTPPVDIYELRNRIIERFVITDSTSLIENVIGPSSGFGILGDLTGFDFHLPFDGNGNTVQSIWDLWMRNNLKDIHDAVGGKPLTGTKMWIGTSSEADWGFHEQTEAWISSLRTKGYIENRDYTVYRYTGYDGKPARGSEYVYDLLRKMLKFHSDAFGH